MLRKNQENSPVRGMGIKSLIRYSLSLLVSSGHVLESTSNGVTGSDMVLYS
jgi:hypothetical protein